MCSTNAPSRVSRSLLLIAPLLTSCQAVGNLVTSMFRTPEKSGRMVDGKQEGEWVYRYLPSGATKAKGNYRDDKQIGHWVYYYENQNVEWEGEFDEARLSGPSLFGYENGKRRALGMFVNGLEEDLWTFWSSDGSISQEGDFAQGKAVLRWAYFHRDGSPMAEGYRLNDQRVGPWQFYTPEGELSERLFPLPEGTEIVHETWDGVVPRREGFLVHGVQTGRWVTSHPNGRRRLTGDFEDGQPHGLWLAWADTGEPVAQGPMAHGRPTGTWYVWRQGVKEKVPGQGLSLTRSFPGEWSIDGAPTASPESAFEVWIAEATSPITGVLNIEPDPNTPPPPREYVAATDETPQPPIRPQPWTVREETSLDFLVARYSDGARNVRAPRGSGYGRRSSRRTAEPDRGGDPKLSPRFIGTELPWTRFFRGQGEVVDLDQFRGSKKVVLVVLRGMSREVCVYCVTQTEALCTYFEDFAEADAEVFVVYPGERNRLDAFMESFRTFSQRLGEPPIGVLYDRDMELVTRMGLTSEFAIPSTFVLDENGKIRYSYVGLDIADRPQTEEVLEAVRGLGP